MVKLHKKRVVKVAGFKEKSGHNILIFIKFLRENVFIFAKNGTKNQKSGGSFSKNIGLIFAKICDFCKS